MPYDTSKPVPTGGLDDYDPLQIEDVRSPNMRNVRSDRNRISRGPGATLFAEAPIPGVTVGAGVVVGSFTKQAGTGTQAVAHQLGAAPVGAIFWGTALAASASATAAVTFWKGMTDGTTSRCLAIAVPNGSTTTNGFRSWQTVPVTILGTAGTTTSQASFSAWSASTFTLNWTTNDGVASTINYILFGQSGMSAEVLPWTANTSTGNQSVGTTAFTSDVVFHMTSSQTSTGISSTDARVGLGMMCADGTQAAVVASIDNDDVDGPLIDTLRGSTDNATILLAAAPGGLDAVATFQSMSGTGFTVNWTNAPASAWLMASLCVDGFSSAKILKMTRAVGSAPYTQELSGYAASPDFLYGLTAWSSLDSTSSLQDGSALLGVGAATPGQQGVSAAIAEDGDASSTLGRTVTASDALLVEVGPNSSSLNLKARLSAITATGFSLQWITATGTADENMFFLATTLAASAATEVGVIRNYFQGYTGTTGTEKILMLSSKTASVYNAGTGVFDVSSESYTATAGRRFYVANTLDVIAHAFDASASAPMLRQYDGSSWSDLVTSGTNHGARFLIAFNDRFVSGYTYHSGSVHPTQLRWCRSAQGNNWDTSTGSAGVLEAIETSNAHMTGLFVQGERAFITKRIEIIELIPTGTTTPVFRQVTRIPGTGCIAPYSFGFGEFFTFFLGPDDVFLFDGSQLKSIGDRYRDVISELLNYNDLDDVQGEYLQSSAEYKLRIGNDIFIYDFRQDKWYRDYIADQAAIGKIRVGGLITTDVDHSEFMVLGTTGNQTLRVTDAENTILGSPMDSYVETKDFYAMRPTRGGPEATIGWMNTLWLFQFHTDPTAVVEIGYSLDRGATWVSEDVAANRYGIGQLFKEITYQVIRFRFRNPRDESFQVYGAYTWRWDTGGMALTTEG